MNLKPPMPLHKLDHLTASVDLTAIPQQNDWTGKMAQEIAKECDDLQAGDVDSMVFHVEAQSLSFGRDGECADCRKPLACLTMTQDGRFSLWGPGFTQVGNEQKAAFVEENQMGAKLSGVFLYVAIPTSSSGRCNPRFAEWPDALVSGSSIPSREPKATIRRPGCISPRNASGSACGFASKSRVRLNGRKPPRLPKAAFSDFPFDGSKAGRVCPAMSGASSLSNPACDTFGTSAQRNSRMRVRSGRSTERVCLDEPGRQPCADAFPTVGRTCSVSCPTLCHISNNVSITF